MSPNHSILKNHIFHLARAWNSLDLNLIVPHLADNAVYESQWTMHTISGKYNVIKHLNNKFAAIKQLKKIQFHFVKADIGVVPELNNLPCIVLVQITPVDVATCTVMITADNNLIKRIDVCFYPGPNEIKLLHNGY